MNERPDRYFYDGSCRSLYNMHANKMKIGFCFLIYKNLSQEKTWQKFFEDKATKEYGIYTHPKHPKKVKQKLLKETVINNLVKTGWGKLNLVEASLNLFEAAIEDGCDYVFLLSGSCVPIHSFNYIHKKIKENPKNRIHFCDEEVKHGYFGIDETFRRYNGGGKIKDYFNLEEFVKSEQWLGLTAKDVKFLRLARKDTISMFENVFAADEHYIPTMLKKSKALDESINCPTTYTNWNDNIDWRHPVRYKKIDNKILDKAYDSGSFFLRKTSGFCNSYRAISQYNKKLIDIPRRKKYIAFIHIPKNGGCSVKSLFKDHGTFLNFSHKSAKEIKEDLGVDLWKECYSFAIVRNPWSRVLSAFTFFQRGGIDKYNDAEKAKSLGITKDKDFNEWVIENENNFINKRFPFAGTEGWMHFKRQTQYINHPIDEIFKLEEFNEHDIIYPFKKLIPHENKSFHEYHTAIYEKAAREIIFKAYQKDIRAFDYSF
jgi:hypothetical protein